MPDLKLRFHKDMLVVAPLFTGELLDPERGQSVPLPNSSRLDLQNHNDECLEFLNILDEDLIRETHRSFLLAGAQCAATNTLRANRPALQAYGLEDALTEINQKGVRLAREVGYEHILATVEILDPEILLEQIKILLPENPDALWLVGSAENPQLSAAIACIRELTDLPIIAPLGSCLNQNNERGADKRNEADILYLMGDSLDKTLQELHRMTRRFAQPLMVCPHAGVPGGATKQQRNRSLCLLTDNLVNFALESRALGVQFVGTEPGSLPVFTGSASAVLYGLDVKAC
ncbi:MAG: homocysteine S-methyltransferase family protein [Coriobacteriales bacterium]|jgi:hypothetical protein|nr:homocysteine S-methyltransferase family protein [Coriobacteriales bacterium]